MPGKYKDPEDEMDDIDYSMDIPDDIGDADDAIKAGVDASGSGPENAGTQDQANLIKGVNGAIAANQKKKADERRTSGDAEGDGNTPDDPENPPKNDFRAAAAMDMER